MVVLLHTPEWGTDGGSPAGFSIDSVKYDYIKNNDDYDAVTEGNVRYYQSNKVIDEFELDNGVFDWGNLEIFTWNIKTELDNIMLYSL